jgi:hypothetical protein
MSLGRGRWLWVAVIVLALLPIIGGKTGSSAITASCS